MNNYHTHTFRCMHAQGEDEDYIKAAITAGIKEIGFSDHCPWPYKNYVSSIRMPASQLDDYIYSISKLKQQYSNQISVKIGLECEYFPDYIEWLASIKQNYNLDFLLLGIHYYPSDETARYMHREALSQESLYSYQKACIDGMDTGLFECLAHPDLYLRFVPSMSKQHIRIAENIIKKALELNIVLEYNLNSLYYKNYKQVNYNNPSPQFWQIVANYNAKVIIGHDAHAPDSLKDFNLYNHAYQFLKSISSNIVNTII